MATSMTIERACVVLDVNVWLSALGPAGRIDSIADLLSLNIGGPARFSIRTVRGLVQAEQSGTPVTVNASRHILDLLQSKLEEQYSWLHEDAARAVSLVAGLCVATGGQYDLDTKAEMPRTRTAIPEKHLRNHGTREADVDHEDLVVIATACSAARNGQLVFLVTNDGGLQLVNEHTMRRLGVAIMFPRNFALAAGF